MKSKEIEVIVSRHFAECLALPVFIVDPLGSLVYYNEPAEDLLGKRFEDTGAMPVEEWSVLFRPEDEDGNPIPPESLPLVKTLNLQQPAHGSLYISSLTGDRHNISITSIPFIGRAGKFIAAVAIFWKNS